MKTKFIKACENKLKMMKGKVVIPCTSCESCCERMCWPFKKETEMIPKDVPKGHLVVYVGENYKRFVIKISLLKHPLFVALLDQAQDVYNFTTNSKLWIPCDENTFLDVVRCAGAPQHQRICMCL
ncbi:PREDICTED: indole-3-acetic acid-induced protein ARG7-like [Tarenaya hassleriana]|uniref:indole-3-acetic acid-induced protein ARG7-like n=1 Tax=Tarenaya hassleriana TaxID=28532 RepID=UPI00053C1FE9|nr:PREDICTED: indole-3-acetic acid-induced protein ARG7-like [Tarenaya hassleriana]